MKESFESEMMRAFGFNSAIRKHCELLLDKYQDEIMVHSGHERKMLVKILIEAWHDGYDKAKRR